jgi:nitrogenase subunit NifH
MSLIKQLTEAKHIGKVLKKENVTLEILHKNKLVLKIGKDAKPKLSSLLTLSKDIEIVDLKELRKLDKE